MIINKKNGFIIPIKVLAVIGVITAVIAAFVIKAVNSYQNRIFEIGYTNTLTNIENGIKAMEASGKDYFYSPLYSKYELDDYSQKPGKFLSDIIGISKDCGNSNGSCFSNKYRDENNKEYTPEYNGACAILKNGISICMTPQIKKDNIKGVMDINGKNSPNILGKDLRTFEIKAKIRNYSPDDDEIEETKYIPFPNAEN